VQNELAVTRGGNFPPKDNKFNEFIENQNDLTFTAFVDRDRMYQRAEPIQPAHKGFEHRLRCSRRLRLRKEENSEAWSLTTVKMADRRGRT